MRAGGNGRSAGDRCRAAFDMRLVSRAFFQSNHGWIGNVEGRRGEEGCAKVAPLFLSSSPPLSPPEKQSAIRSYKGETTTATTRPSLSLSLFPSPPFPSATVLPLSLSSHDGALALRLRLFLSVLVSDCSPFLRLLLRIVLLCSGGGVGGAALLVSLECRLSCLPI